MNEEDSVALVDAAGQQVLEGLVVRLPDLARKLSERPGDDLKGYRERHRDITTE